MRLQGAIFHLPGALLDETGAPRNGVKEFLSVMKMEGVWMYGVTAQPLEVPPLPAPSPAWSSWDPTAFRHRPDPDTDCNRSGPEGLLSAAV